MENRQQQILSEIKEMMSLIRTQLEQLDAKMAELQYEVDPQEFTSEPIDLSLDDFTIETVPEDPVVEEMAVVFEEPVIEEVGLPVEENGAGQTGAAERFIDKLPTERYTASQR